MSIPDGALLGCVKMLHTGPVSSTGPTGASVSSRGLHILEVDDNRVNLSVAVRMVAKLGHTSATASNGLEALHAIGSQRFDLVLMDIQMPVMDGFEETRRIREKEADQCGHIPIIAVTAHAIPGDQERFLAGGMDAYLPKPVSLYDLAQTLAAVRQTPVKGPPWEQGTAMCWPLV